MAPCFDSARFRNDGCFDLWAIKDKLIITTHVDTYETVYDYPDIPPAKELPDYFPNACRFVQQKMEMLLPFFFPSSALPEAAPEKPPEMYDTVDVRHIAHVTDNVGVINYGECIMLVTAWQRGQLDAGFDKLVCPEEYREAGFLRPNFVATPSVESPHQHKYKKRFTKPHMV